MGDAGLRGPIGRRRIRPLGVGGKTLTRASVSPLDLLRNSRLVHSCVGSGLGFVPVIAGTGFVAAGLGLVHTLLRA